MDFLFVLFALSITLILVSTLLLIGTSNLIHSCVFLLGTLIGVAGLYVTLGADYVAAIQVLVYVGGVVILMLFAVMLTGGQDFIKWGRSLRHFIPPMGNKRTLILALLSSSVLIFSLVQMIKNISERPGLKDANYTSTVERIGSLLITDHVLAFEIVSVLLLGALIGAAIIARPVRQDHEDDNHDHAKK